MYSGLAEQNKSIAATKKYFLIAMETDPVYQKSENGMQRLYEKLDQTFVKEKNHQAKMQTSLK